MTLEKRPRLKNTSKPLNEILQAGREVKGGLRKRVGMVENIRTASQNKQGCSLEKQL